LVTLKSVPFGEAACQLKLSALERLVLFVKLVRSALGADGLPASFMAVPARAL